MNDKCLGGLIFWGFFFTRPPVIPINLLFDLLAWLGVGCCISPFCPLLAEVFANFPAVSSFLFLLKQQFETLLSLHSDFCCCFSHLLASISGIIV